MNSKKTVRTRTSQKPLPSPKRDPYKFLMRNLKGSYSIHLSLQQIRVKRLFLKNMIDQRERETPTKETIFRPFKHNKLFKTLKNVQISSVRHSYFQECLKNCKRIKDFRIESTSDQSHMNKIPPFVKRLPISVQNLRLNIVKRGLEIPKHFYDIAKSIRRLPKLQDFHRWFLLDTDRKRNHLTKEFTLYDKSLSRLPKMKKFMCSLGHNEIYCLQRMMRRGDVHPGISGLKMFFTADEVPSYNLLEPFFEPEDSRHSGESFDFSHMDDTEQRFFNKFTADILEEDNELEDNSLNYQNRRRQNIRNNPPPPQIPIQPRPRRHPDPYDDDGEDDESDIESDIASSVASEGGPRPRPDFLVNCMMREEIKPFFRFELFPNLKRLGIIQEEYMYPLGKFVVDAFAQLTRLEHLTVDILERSIGTSNIFKGLLRLPLLKKFSFRISFVKKKEWLILEQFLKNQTNLEILSLSVRKGASNKTNYFHQNAHIENIIKDLAEKPNIKSLQFRSDFWSIETFSRGFAHLSNMKNQLESFRFGASDEIITSENKHWKRVEGLCNFIKNQKDSLKRLSIFLPLALEANIVNHISEAISKLTVLRELHFSVNPCILHDLDTIAKYFTNNLQHGVSAKAKKRLIESASWNPSIAKNLKKLKNLEMFSLTFNMRDLGEKDPYRWFLDILKALPGLEKLRRVSVTCDYGLVFRNLEEKLTAAVKEFRNVRDIGIGFYEHDFIFAPSYRMLKGALKEVNERQALRCDLMF